MITFYGNLLLSLTMCSQPKQYPVGVAFDPYVFRSGDNGDNWCLTWGADGDLYTSQCDGRGWHHEDGTKRNFMNNQRNNSKNQQT